MPGGRAARPVRASSLSLDRWPAAGLVQVGPMVPEGIVARRCVGLLIVGPNTGLPPDRRLGADSGQLGLGVDQAVALQGGELVLLAHRDRVHRADLRAEATEEAAAGLEDELAELAVALL